MNGKPTIAILLGDYAGIGPELVADFDNIKMGRINTECGLACIKMMEKAVDLYHNKKIDGICFAPFNKAAMKKAGLPAESEMEFFSLLIGEDNTFCEINMLDDVWTT